ncbi:MAG: hypothetical protein ACI9XJ_001308 [Marivirga sp.]|jgi:hypothetical protein
MKIIYKTLILFFISSVAYSQANCDKNLNDARSDYANGNLYAIPGKLTDCLNNGFDKAERIEAYQLLALTYININQLDKARESLIKLLKIKSDYTVTKNVAPDELYSLYKKIDTDPIYYLGTGVGINFTFPFLPDSSNRSTTNSNPGVENYNYSPTSSFSAGVQFIYPVYKFLHAKAFLSYDVNKYKYSQTATAFNSSENVTITDYTGTNAGINLILSGRIMSEEKKYGVLKPFFEVGLITRFHLNSFINDYEDLNTKKGQSQSFLATGLKMNTFRRDMNMGINLQLGSMIKFQENYLEVSFGASYYGLPEAKNTDSDGSRLTVANATTVIEDRYNKIVLNFTVNFNVPFYNFE